MACSIHGTTKNVVSRATSLYKLPPDEKNAGFRLVGLEHFLGIVNEYF
jgi:hypothetical protein